VRILDRAATRQELPQVAHARFDLGSDPDAELARHLDGIEAVFHLAGVKHNQRAAGRELLATNVGGMQALLEHAARAGVKKVVFASSLYVYGRLSGPPMVETERPQPDTLYGVSKLAGEGLLACARQEHRLASVALRYFFVYGPRQRDSVVTANFERLLRGEPPVVFGDGRQAFDYVYVGDVVEATLRAMESDVDGEVLNVGSGQPTEIGALTAAMTEASGRRLEAVRGPADWTAGSCRVADAARIRQVLGWQATTRLRDGLEQTWRWLQDSAR
jgi:nucleoside-diphosphate-sugar epimerase